MCAGSFFRVHGCCRAIYGHTPAKSRTAVHIAEKVILLELSCCFVHNEDNNSEQTSLHMMVEVFVIVGCFLCV